MPALSFVLVEPGKPVTPASKHQERVGIHSHAQKITQQRKRQRRLKEQAKKSRIADTANPGMLVVKNTFPPKLNGDHNVGAIARMVTTRSNYSHGLLTLFPELERPLTNYSLWTDDHKYGIGMFQHVTIVDINDLNTNMAFWTEVIPAYSETWECVRGIVSAIAGANQAIQNRDEKLFLTALDLHVKAISSLRKELTALPLSAQVACCLLLEAFNILRCDFSTGKQIDYAKMLTRNVSVSTYLKDENLATVCDALTKMCQIPMWSLWNPTHFLKYEGLRYAETNLNLELETLDFSNGVLEGLVESMQITTRQFSGRIRRNLSETAYVDPNCRMAQDVLHELQTWRAYFDEYLATDPPAQNREMIQQADLAWNFAHVTFTAGVLGCGELIFDEPRFLPYFTRINDISRQCFAESTGFSKRAAIKAFLQILVPSLWLLVLMCRDPSIRAHTIAILKSRHYQESDFNSIIAGRIGEAVIQIETRDKAIKHAAQIPLSDRVRVEGIRYDLQAQQVVLSYSFVEHTQSDVPFYEKRIPWQLQGDLIKFNNAIGGLSQMCALYRKVKCSAAPLGYIKPMYYKGELVPVRLTCR